MAESINPPPNFSWIVDNRLAAMAWPETTSNLLYIIGQGIKHLVTLSPEVLPPVESVSGLRWTVIDIEDFAAPSLDQMKKFIAICENSDKNDEAVGIHCRMGIGRTGTMAACYLMRFLDLPPERAIAMIRLSRPGSIETIEQEKAVAVYHDYLRGTKL